MAEKGGLQIQGKSGIKAIEAIRQIGLVLHLAQKLFTAQSGRRLAVDLVESERVALMLSPIVVGRSSQRHHACHNEGSESQWRHRLNEPRTHTPTVPFPSQREVFGTRLPD